jgi:transcriptional regulator with XRE-family HTH domain
MSLGDELRFLRAMKGGRDLTEIAEACGVDNHLYSQIEKRYRQMGDDETLEKLAGYFGVSVDSLKWHRARYRKALSRALQNAQNKQDVLSLRMRNGVTLRGRVDWWDLGTLGLAPEDGGELIVVQRHAVIDWEPFE